MEPLSTQQLPAIFNFNLIVKSSTTQVFEAISQFVCQIHTLRGTSSGIMIGANRVVVPFHVLDWLEVKKEADQDPSAQAYKSLPITVNYANTTYTAIWSGTDKLNPYVYFDTSIFEIIDRDFLPRPSISIECDLPKPGERVYYAAYPLKQNHPSFHKGRVSSVEEETGIFAIDGTVLPGDSGGPVFVLRNNQLFLVGMIFAELSNINPSLKQAMAGLQAQGGLVFSIGGIDLKGVISETITTVFANLATGIGKVIGIAQVQKLLNGNVQLPSGPSPFQFDFHVMRGERMPGLLSNDRAYLNWYHLKVKQNPVLCMKILGRQLGAAESITSDEEKNLLWPYYQKNVSSSDSKGYAGFEQTDEMAFLKLKDKIKKAKPKALRQHSEVWGEMLNDYMDKLPQYSNDINELFGFFPGSLSKKTRLLDEEQIVE